MKIHSLRVIIAYISFLIAIASCKKGWLDAKSKQSFITLETVKDLKSLMNNIDLLNSTQMKLGEGGVDDYYITSAYYQAAYPRDRNIYRWAPGSGFYAGNSTQDWDNTTEAIYCCNRVLEALGTIPMTDENRTDWQDVKGSALFYRANSYYQLAQHFCKPYIQATASTDLGIILRTSSSVGLPSERVNIQRTYDQIIHDLREAKELVLLSQIHTYKTHPTKPAVLALLARTYLSMEEYDSAFYYAGACLQLYNRLMDYNNTTEVDTSLANPILFPANEEILFYSSMENYPLMASRVSNGIVDSLLFQSYDINDLRRKVFFRVSDNRLVFIGNYGGKDFPLFNGLATDEVYLIRAECYARKGNKDLALGDLDTLLKKRWNKAVTYIPVSATDAEDALRKILFERRKELCFRNIRWTDLRRLNKDPRFAITLRRIINGVEYPLPANDNRYVYPFPDSEINYSNIQQNPR